MNRSFVFAVAILSEGFALACAPLGAPAASSLALPYVIDTITTDAVARGVTHGFVYIRSGPWAMHVLAVDLDRCNAAVAVKGFDGAIGRTRTSALMARLGFDQSVLGGVNADFFSLVNPQGVPANALISGGRVISGPSAQPVLAFDAGGLPHIATLSVRGSASFGGHSYAIDGWNHAISNGLALFDTNWSRKTDTASSAVKVAMSGGPDPRVMSVDTTTEGTAVPPGGAVLVAGKNAPEETRAALLALKSGDVIRATVALVPSNFREAVGGRPLLVRDSLVLSTVDDTTLGQPGFATNRHPRTAAGIARGGTRLVLVVVDGRQAPYSDGMTLRELANFMLALGARDAINLDGGGSSAMIYADSSRALRIANRPSDLVGERPVGDALAIVTRCVRRADGALPLRRLH